MNRQLKKSPKTLRRRHAFPKYRISNTNTCDGNTTFRCHFPMRNIGPWVLNRLHVLLSVWTNLAVIHVLDEVRHDLSHKKGSWQCYNTLFPVVRELGLCWAGLSASSSAENRLSPENVIYRPPSGIGTLIRRDERCESRHASRP